MTEMRQVDRPLPEDVAIRPVAGHGVPTGSTFASVVDQADPVLVVFLRHYG